MSRQLSQVFFAIALIFVASSVSRAQISLSVAYTAYQQDFNTLAITGTTNTTVPTGWAFAETGTGADLTYSTGTGSNNAGNTYSFGTSNTSTERAFGMLQSAAVGSRIGAQFINNTGITINELQITYDGELWRRGATNRSDTLDFAISTNATSLTTGTYTSYTSLNFISNSGTATANGSTAGPVETSAINGTVTGLNIADGQVFWIRWLDVDVTGADDGMAVDNFSMTPVPEPATILGLSAITVAAGSWLRRTRRVPA